MTQLESPHVVACILASRCSGPVENPWAWAILRCFAIAASSLSLRREFLNRSCSVLILLLTKKNPGAHTKHFKRSCVAIRGRVQQFTANLLQSKTALHLVQV